MIDLLVYLGIAIAVLVILYIVFALVAGVWAMRKAGEQMKNMDAELENRFADE